MSWIVFMLIVIAFLVYWDADRRESWRAKRATRKTKRLADREAARLERLRLAPVVKTGLREGIVVSRAGLAKLDRLIDQMVAEPASEESTKRLLDLLALHEAILAAHPQLAGAAHRDDQARQ